jgi:hypothetical protein
LERTIAASRPVAFVLYKTLGTDYFLHNCVSNSNGWLKIVPIGAKMGRYTEIIFEIARIFEAISRLSQPVGRASSWM